MNSVGVLMHHARALIKELGYSGFMRYIRHSGVLRDRSLLLGELRIY